MQDIVTRIASIPFMDIGIYYFVAEAACIVAFLYRRKIAFELWYVVFGGFLVPTTIILYAYFYLGFTPLNHSWSHIALLQFLTIVSSGSICWALFRRRAPYRNDNLEKSIYAAVVVIIVGVLSDYYFNIEHFRECLSLKCKQLSYIFGNNLHVSFFTYGSLIFTSGGLIPFEAAIFRLFHKR
ncbi:hypothetical protein [Ciceribacter sp. RN22]|uniref:hypothetical protein n=1 Tax=Ciceribacter sp. RN22 TaxID=2954932 RepID=UPI0020933DF6|nr:hypothetical protein [Ciceribacter sp. RN22]MCO6178441.1 hypothetical protein [Ciceribacter sp. RN22]